MGKYSPSLRYIFVCLIAFAGFFQAAAQTNFGSVNLGAASTVMVTLTPSRNDALTSVSVVTQGSASLDFTQVSGGTCDVGASYYACTVMVSFNPKFANTRYGAVILSDATGVVATAYLSGIGNGPQLAFSYSTGSVTPFLVPTTLTGEPQSVAIDDSGNLYVGDDGSISGPPTNRARIIKLTYSAGTYTQSTIASGLYDVRGLSLDGAGNLYYTVGGSLYKATPINGTYSSSLVGAYAGGVADGLGNIYYASGGLSFGTPANLYSRQLQPDGSYVARGPFAVDPVKIDQNGYDATCSPGSLDGFAIANGILYFEGYDACNDEYSGTSTASAVYGYTNGLDQSAVLLSSSTIPRISAMSALDMAGTPYNTLYFWFAGGLWGSLSKIGDGLGEIADGTPSGVAANAGGDVAITSAGYIVSGTNDVSTTGSGVYVMHRSTPPTESFPPTGQGTVSYSGGQYLVGNIGNQPINLSGIAYPADFSAPAAAVGDCAANQTLSADSNACQITTQFSPTVSLGSATSNVLTESATLTSDSLPAPVLIPFTGTEVAATANPVFSPTPGTYSGDQTITITEATPDTVVWYRINGNVLSGSSSYIGPFPITSSATIEAYAVSTTSGMSQVVTATYTLTPDFVFSASSNSLTIASGTTGTATLTVAPHTGFTSAISFSCTGLPPGVTCSFSPATVTPSGSVASTTTLSLNIPTTLGEVHRTHEMTSLALTALFFGFGGLTFRRRLRPMLSVAVIGLVFLSASGCASPKASTLQVAPVPVNATITVVATSGTLQHSTTIALYVP